MTDFKDSISSFYDPENPNPDKLYNIINTHLKFRHYAKKDALDQQYIFLHKDENVYLLRNLMIKGPKSIELILTLINENRINKDLATLSESVINLETDTYKNILKDYEQKDHKMNYKFDQDLEIDNKLLFDNNTLNNSTDYFKFSNYAVFGYFKSYEDGIFEIESILKGGVIIQKTKVFIPFFGLDSIFNFYDDLIVEKDDAGYDQMGRLKYIASTIGKETDYQDYESELDENPITYFERVSKKINSISLQGNKLTSLYLYEPSNAIFEHDLLNKNVTQSLSLFKELASTELKELASKELDEETSFENDDIISEDSDNGEFIDSFEEGDIDYSDADNKDADNKDEDNNDEDNNDKDEENSRNIIEYQKAEFENFKNQEEIGNKKFRKQPKNIEYDNIENINTNEKILQSQSTLICNIDNLKKELIICELEDKIKPESIKRRENIAVLKNKIAFCEIELTNILRKAIGEPLLRNFFNKSDEAIIRKFRYEEFRNIPPIESTELKMIKKDSDEKNKLPSDLTTLKRDLEFLILLNKKNPSDRRNDKISNLNKEIKRIQNKKTLKLHEMIQNIN